MYTNIHTYTHMESNAHICLQRRKGLGPSKTNEPSQHVIIEKFCNTKLPCYLSSARKVMFMEHLPRGCHQQLRGTLCPKVTLLYSPHGLSLCSWLWILGKERLLVYSSLPASSDAPIRFNCVQLSEVFLVFLIFKMAPNKSFLSPGVWPHLTMRC